MSSRLDEIEQFTIAHSKPDTVVYGHIMELVERCRKLEKFVKDIRYAYGRVGHYQLTEEALKQLEGGE